MRKILVVLLLTISAGFTTSSAQKLPPQKETLDVVMKVNKYFMEKYADYRTPSFVRNVTRPSNIWTRGVYYEGLMALYSIYPRAEFYDYAYNWAEYHEWGMRNGNTTRNADDYCCGQTYIDLYNICPKPEMLKNIKSNMNMLVNTPQVGDWTWVDAIQMGMPVLAKMGHLTGEQKYFDKMWDMYEFSRNQLAGKGMFNLADGLWWRDADFLPHTKNPMEKTAIGAGETDGPTPRWYAYLTKFQPMKNTAKTTSTIS